MFIQNNQVVSIEYEVREVGNQEILDSNIGKELLTFIIGRGQIISGLEDKLLGMKMDEQSDVLVKANDAYGEYNNEAVMRVPIEQFSGIELQIGMPLYGQSEDGQTVMVTVKEFNDNEVAIDYNHPLAGKDLMFSVKVLDIRDATVEETMTGQVQKSNDGCGCGTGCGCH